MVDIGIEIVLSVALFVLPGYAFLTVFRKSLHFDIGEMICASAGVSLAVVPLIVYITTYLGVLLTRESVMMMLFIAAGVSIWDWGQRFLNWRREKELNLNQTYVYLGVIFLLVLASRLWMVQGIDFPLWTDSYHHTMITQLIIDQGGVPSSYEPYAPISRFTYHFGFHTVAAWFHWLTGEPTPRSVVLAGQIINALVVPTIYLLAGRLFRNPVSGLIAALIVGLFSHMPVIFVNWGRYTQLCGQIVLPVLMILTIEALDLSKTRVSHWLLVGILGAGLFLIHIRVFLFFGIFAALLFGGKLVQAWPQPAQLKRLLVGSLTIGMTILVIDAPWIWRFYQGFGQKVVQVVSEGYQPTTQAAYLALDWRDLFRYGMRPEWYLIAGIGAIWGISKKEPYVWLLLAWTLALFGAANLHILGVTPLLSNTIVIICLYLPIASLAGYFFGQLLAKFSSLLSRLSAGTIRKLQAVATLIILIVMVVAAIYLTRLIAPENGFVQPADLNAMAWIEQNLPRDNVLFDIKTHFWTPEVAHGLDGGYWIPLLTGRQTIMPPQVYNSDGTPEYADFINQRARALTLANNTPEQLWQAIIKYDVTHIYIGSRKTDWGPEIFLTYPAHFDPIYSKDGVWIFKVIR